MSEDDEIKDADEAACTLVRFEGRTSAADDADVPKRVGGLKRLWNRLSGKTPYAIDEAAGLAAEYARGKALLPSSEVAVNNSRAADLAAAADQKAAETQKTRLEISGELSDLIEVMLAPNTPAHVRLAKLEAIRSQFPDTAEKLESPVEKMVQLEIEKGASFHIETFADSDDDNGGDFPEGN